MCIICVFKDIEQKEEQQRIATVNPKMEYKFLHRKQCIATLTKIETGDEVLPCLLPGMKLASYLLARIKNLLGRFSSAYTKQ